MATETPMNDWTAIWEQDAWRAGILLGGSVLLAGAIHILGGPLLRRLAHRTSTSVDDVLAQALPFPLAVSVLLVGIQVGIEPLALDDILLQRVRAVSQTFAVLVWARASSRVVHAMLGGLSRRAGQISLVQPRTLPLFEMAANTLLYGGAAYLVLIAWNIDVSAWLASAGVVGVAVGFASKDSLSNLFAGLFIIADSPYKIGDFLIIDEKTRGRVTQIGLRSTRIVTRDDVEIIVPNSVMAGARITNESGGPHEPERIRCPLLVAYGTDMDKLRPLLVEVAMECPLLERDKPGLTPRVRIRALDDNGIRLELLGWVIRPELRGPAIDDLLDRVLKAFRREGIEIPFPQQVVHLRDHRPMLTNRDSEEE